MKINKLRLLNYINKCKNVDVVTVASKFNISRSHANRVLKDAYDAGILVRHLITVIQARKTYEYSLKTN